MKSIGRLLLLGAALALLAPTSSWADHTDYGSRHGIRRPDRTHHRADHRRSRLKHRPSVYVGYNHHGGVTVRFGYGYRYGHSRRHYRRRASYRHDSYYRRHHRRHDYDRHYYDYRHHRGHH